MLMFIEKYKIMHDLKQSLQTALDNRDCEQINSIMQQIYPDYLKSYATTLIVYNEQYDIHGADLINLKLLYPNVKFIALVCFEPEQVKKYCIGGDLICVNQ